MEFLSRLPLFGSLANAAFIIAGSLLGLALRSRLPLSVIQRDLFLFGMEQVELLQPLREAGFAKHDKLLLGARDSKGYLSFRGQQVDYPQAGMAAQAFLQDSFIGLVLSGQQHASP